MQYYILKLNAVCLKPLIWFTEDTQKTPKNTRQNHFPAIDSLTAGCKDNPPVSSVQIIGQ